MHEMRDREGRWTRELDRGKPGSSYFTKVIPNLDKLLADKSVPSDFRTRLEAVKADLQTDRPDYNKAFTEVQTIAKQFPSRSLDVDDALRSAATQIGWGAKRVHEDGLKASGYAMPLKAVLDAHTQLSKMIGDMDKAGARSSPRMAKEYSALTGARDALAWDEYASAADRLRDAEDASKSAARRKSYSDIATMLEVNAPGGGAQPGGKPGDVIRSLPPVPGAGQLAKSELDQAARALDEGDREGAAEHLRNAAAVARGRGYSNAADDYDALATKLRDTPDGLPPQPPDAFSVLSRIQAEAAASEDDDTEVSENLRWAARTMDAANPGTNWHTQAASYLKRAADAADKHGNADRAKRIRAMITDMRRVPLDEPPNSDAGNARKLLDTSSVAVPQMIGHGSVFVWDGKTPDLYADSKKPGVLAETGWDGHITINRTTAKLMREAMSGTGQVFPSQISSFTVPLHEMIHATVQPGGGSEQWKTRDMSLYQKPGPQKIEESLTELGTILHAPDFFTRIGIGDRETPFTKPEGGHFTVSEYAGQVRDPDRIKGDDAWGHYQGWVPQMYAWMDTVSRKSGHEPDDLDSIQEMSDELNAGGVEHKMDTLATQFMRTRPTYADLSPDESDRVTSRVRAALSEQFSNRDTDPVKTYMAALNAYRNSVDYGHAATEHDAIAGKAA